MDKPKFVYVTYINATPYRVWQALTRPEFTRQYWGGWSIESDWKPGSPVRYVNYSGEIDADGKVIECRPTELLSFTFHSRPLTTVTFRLEPFGTVTRLTGTREGFEPDSKETRTSRRAGSFS
jgi:Uncharacterized conserved protein